MVTLTQLPEELLLSIAEHAAIDQGSHSILQLVLVDRALARLALPLLYRHISDQGASFRASGEVLIRGLLRVLLFDASKRLLVQTIDLEYGSFQDESFIASKETPDPLASLSKNERARIQGMIDETFEENAEENVERQVRWTEACLGKKSTAYLFALVFARLPNLREFKLLDPNDTIWRILGTSVDGLIARAQSLGLRMPLLSLEKVTTGDETEKYPSSTIPLTVIVRWPGVKHIHGIQTGDGDNGDFGMEPPEPDFLALESRIRDLQTITLRPKAKLQSDNLVKLLGTAKALEAVDYYIGHAWAWVPVDTPKLLQALSQHTHSLKSLVLHLFVGEEEQEDAVFEPMSFFNFSCLETLEIACALLLGSNSTEDRDLAASKEHAIRATPPSIKKLSIIQCDSTSDAEVASAIVQNVMEERGRKFMKLENVKWACSELRPAVDVLAKENEHLHRIARSRGVALSTMVDSESYGTAGIEFTDFEVWFRKRNQGDDVEKIASVDEESEEDEDDEAEQIASVDEESEEDEVDDEGQGENEGL